VALYDLVGIAADPSHGTVTDPQFAYIVSDGQMAQGSTIGAPRCCIILKPTGAIRKIFCPDAGRDFFGAVAIHYWDRRSCIRLDPHHGEFHLHPERQDHVYRLPNGVYVHEQVFPYNTDWTEGHGIAPPAVYYRAHYRNQSESKQRFDAYVFCELRGNTAADIVAEYDASLGGIVAWNKTTPSYVRLFGLLEKPDGWEVNSDRGKVVSETAPGKLANKVIGSHGDPLGVLHAAIDLDPGEDRWVEVICVLSPQSREDLAASRKACPGGEEALRKTSAYYWKFLRRSVIRAPDRDVNQGVLWAKANMLRVWTYAPTGWCFTNDPTRSNNSVGRDTAWMSFGADYVNPEFSREALSAFFRLQEPNGKIVEFYDVRNEKWEDYGLNVNDDTPLVVLALWHHYAVTRNEEFLRRCYPKALHAMEYMLSQRNEQGLVWCTATGVADWGIVGWRNVIENYRISGASTEVNSETYAALRALCKMAETLGDEKSRRKYEVEARRLRDAINTHLVNPENGLYYLNIDVDGQARTDITADLLFPVLFGVAPHDRAAKIISVLSRKEFWTDAGMRTVPRDDLMYDPINGFGLLGGVWVALTYWYAFAAAKYDPQFMAYALSSSFRHFSSDPRRNNTVPGQFSEWLHGEILVNQGMTLSPWDAPRYLWAAIEGAAGLDCDRERARIDPALALDWRWLTAADVPFRGRSISWIAVRMPDGMHLYATCDVDSHARVRLFERDVTDTVRVADPTATVVAFAGDGSTLVFVGNPNARTMLTAASLTKLPRTEHAVRLFSTVWNEWEGMGKLPHHKITEGIALTIDARGFALLEITA
jgi:hypothetical protein